MAAPVAGVHTYGGLGNAENRPNYEARRIICVAGARVILLGAFSYTKSAGGGRHCRVGSGRLRRKEA